MALTYRNRDFILSNHPEIAQAFDDITNHLSTIMQQTNSTINGESQPPPAPSKLTVTASQGIFEAKIDDSNPVNRGINYFLQYSQNPSFNAPTTIDLGTSRNHRATLGNHLLYWRAHSAYPTSKISGHAYHGTSNQPIGVSGGGTVKGPDLLPSSGSGTSNGASGSDGGFGNNPFRGTSRPTS